jgi:hypothetical protein
MAKAPQSNLPPQAQPWGRYIEKELADLQLNAGIVGQDSNNTLAQLNSSVQLLSRQQQDLAAQQAALTSQQAQLASQQNYLNGLTSYVSTDGTAPSTTSTSETLIKTLFVTFYLSQTYTVATNATASAYILSYGNTNVYTGGSARCKLQIDSGAEISGGYRGGGTITYSSGIGVVMEHDANIDNAITLNEGWHTITARWYGNLNAGNNSGGYVQILPAVMIVSIIN